MLNWTEGQISVETGATEKEKEKNVLIKPDIFIINTHILIINYPIYGKYKALDLFQN